MTNMTTKKKDSGSVSKTALEQFQADMSSALSKYYKEVHSEAIKRGIALAKQGREKNR